jgi:hypothetical protein
MYLQFARTSIDQLGIDDTQYLINGLIPQEGLTLISGQPKSGKSQLALGIAAATALGKPFGDDARFGGSVSDNPGLVNWVGTDGGLKSEIKSRVAKYPKAMQANLNVEAKAHLCGLIFESRVDPGKFVDRWSAYTEWMKEQGVVLVIVDHLLNLSGGAGVNEDTSTGPIMGVMNKISEMGIVPVLIHHSSAHFSGRSGSPMGHTMIQATMRSNLRVVTAAKSSHFTKVQVISNTASPMTLTLDRLKGEPVHVREWAESETIESDDRTGKERRKKGRDGLDIVRAKAILEGPEECRKDQTQAGQYLLTLSAERVGEITSGREAVKKLIKVGLLVADNRRLVQGPLFETFN